MTLIYYIYILVIIDIYSNQYLLRLTYLSIYLLTYCLHRKCRANAMQMHIQSTVDIQIKGDMK